MTHLDDSVDNEHEVERPVSGVEQPADPTEGATTPQIPEFRDLSLLTKGCGTRPPGITLRATPGNDKQVLVEITDDLLTGAILSRPIRGYIEECYEKENVIFLYFCLRSTHKPEGDPTTQILEKGMYHEFTITLSSVEKSRLLGLFQSRHVPPDKITIIEKDEHRSYHFPAVSIIAPKSTPE